MKKWVVLVVVLVLVIGGGVAAVVGLKNKNKKDGTIADIGGEASFVEEVSPCILAEEKLVLVEGEKSVNTNAETYDATNEIIQYESLDTNIATVDSYGNVFALKKGSTFVRNSFVLDNVEYSYDTRIVVLPNEISGTITLLDENKKEAKSVVVGNKYILNYTTETSLEYFQISLFSTDGIQASGTYDKQDNGFCCEIYFLTRAVHTLGFKLTLKADNLKKDYFTSTLTFDNTEKECQEPESSTPQEPVDEPVDESNEPQTPIVPSEPAPAEPKPSEPTPPSEPQTPLEPTVTQEEMFEIFVGTNKNIAIENSTITITNFTKPTDIALSFKPIHSTQKHTMRVEILSGDNLTIELETSLLGLTISATGTTTFRLFSTTNPALSQIFTIVVE